jgi:hypothetical protein
MVALTEWTGGWEDPEGVRDVLGKRKIKISYPSRLSDPGVIQLASYAISAGNNTGSG